MDAGTIELGTATEGICRRSMPNREAPMSDRICSFDPCERDVKTKGLCQSHYLQSWRGQELRPLWTDWTLRQKIEYYLTKPDGEDGCWLWSGQTSPHGYGVVSWQGKDRRVHRAYLIELGYDIPPKMDVDHLCRVTGCANPAHLEVVTHRENVLRSPVSIPALNAAKTECKNGHPYTAENTYVRPNGNRDCKECQRTRNREWWSRNE